MEVKSVVYDIKDILRSVERLNRSCEDNMKRLNMMMLELKGLIAAVRPQVKKSGWYGDEIQVRPPEHKEQEDLKPVPWNATSGTMMSQEYVQNWAEGEKEFNHDKDPLNIPGKELAWKCGRELDLKIKE